MKRRIIAIAAAAALLAIVAAGCGGTQANVVDGFAPNDPTTVTTTTTEETTEDPYYEEYPYENGEENGENGEATTLAPPAATVTAAPNTPGNVNRPPATTTTTRANTTTTTRPNVNTTRPPNNATTTTTRPPANAPAGSPVNITNSAQALQAFNNAVGRVISNRAGFDKRHTVVYSGWNQDSATIPDNWGAWDGIISGIWGTPDELINSGLQDLLQRGTPTARQTPGQPSNMISQSTLAAGDLRNPASFRRVGNNWEITLNVNNGNTTATSATSFSGSAPIQRGPLNQATDMPPVVHDHMTADRAFAFIRGMDLAAVGLPSIPGVRLADPREVRESTTDTQFVMVIDNVGNMISLRCTYTQVMTIVEGAFIGQTVRNVNFNTRVTVNFTDFRW